jgi:hypothetical protein
MLSKFSAALLVKKTTNQSVESEETIYDSIFPTDISSWHQGDQVRRIFAHRGIV